MADQPNDAVPITTQIGAASEITPAEPEDFLRRAIFFGERGLCLDGSKRSYPKGAKRLESIQADLDGTGVPHPPRRRHWLHADAYKKAVVPGELEAWCDRPLNLDPYSKSRRKNGGATVPGLQLSLPDAFSKKWWTLKAWKAHARRCFLDYLEDIDSKVLLFRMELTQKPVVCDYKVRFSKEELRTTFYKWHGVKITYGSMVTVTPDPKESRNIIECKWKLREEWNNDIRKWLIRHFDLESLSYVQVLEFGKKYDMPHLHTLIDKVVFNKADLDALHAAFPGRHINVIRIRDWDVKGYIVKYAKKVYNSFSVIKDSPAYLYWLTGAKVYSMSKDHYGKLRRDRVAIIDFGIFMCRMLENAYYECLEFVGVYDLTKVDPPPLVVDDDWVNLNFSS